MQKYTTKDRIKNRNIPTDELKGYENIQWDTYYCDMHGYDDFMHEYNPPRIWYKDGQYHRVKGPAIVHRNGHKAWHQYGERHRENGPAIMDHNIGIGWYLGGEEVTSLEHEAIIREVKNLPIELALIDPRGWVRRRAQKEYKRKNRKKKMILLE